MVCLVLAVRRSRSHTLDQGQGQALGLSVEVLNQEEGQGGILLERDHCASHHRVAVAVAAGAASDAADLELQDAGSCMPSGQLEDTEADDDRAADCAQGQAAQFQLQWH